MSFVLEVVDTNSQAIESTLDDVLYYIVIDWNDTFQSWEMGIRNSAYQTLIDGISLVPNFPLLRQFKYPDLPPGELLVQNVHWTSGPIPRDGFASGEYELIYFTAEDLLGVI
jgi:Domain of unknown function (DUF6983)